MSVHKGASSTEIKFIKDDKSDADYVLRYTRFFLRCIGIWPRVASSATRREKNVSKFLLPLCSFTMLSIILPAYIYLALRDVDVSEFILLFAPICHGSSNILEHLLLIFHSDLLKYCVNQMVHDWQLIKSQNDWDIAMQNHKVGRKLSFVCAVGVYSSGALYVVLQPLLMKNTINALNETVRPLVYPGNDIIIDLESGYNYEIVFFCNCISAFLHFTVVNTIFNIASIFVTHACGQIQIIMSRLDSLVEDTDVVTVRNQIAFIISRHVSVLKFSSTVEELLREICLLEVFAATIIICMLEFYCLLEWRNGNKFAVITYSIILVSIIFNLFIYCYVGEILKEKCEEIGRAAYMIEWYKLPEKTGLALVMIMIMSKYPRTLTAGHITELSLATLCNIIKSSFAYLGILQAVVEK